MKVSVIIPIYNSAKYLSRTLKSVINQDFDSWECIIINDGSNDDSEKIALDVVKKDKRFSYIYQENAGVSVARNKGIESAKGEYILCLDGDDLISSNFLTETSRILDLDKNIKVATSKVKYFGRSNGKYVQSEFSLVKLLGSNQMVVTSMFRKLDFDRGCQFNANMRKGLEDWDFWIKLLKSGGQVKCTDKAVFYYRIQKKSRNSSLNSLAQSELRYQMWNNHRELYCEFFVDPKHTEEYISIKNSIEYRIGRLIVAPMRFIKNLF